MNRDMFRLIPLLIMLVICIAIASGLFGDPKKPFESAPLVGYDVVPFNVPTLGSSQMRFAPRDWRGKVVILNVFASWCVPCQDEHKIWMNLARSGKVLIYGLAWKDTPEKVSAWLNQNGNPYQLIGVDSNGNTTVALALTGVPETFLIGPTGSIFYHSQGPVTQELLDTVLVPLAEKLISGEVKAAPLTTDQDPLPMVLGLPEQNGDATAPIANTLQQPSTLPGPNSDALIVPVPAQQNVIAAPEGQPAPPVVPPAAPDAR